MSALGRRISALESASKGGKPDAECLSLLDQSVETLLAKLQAEWSLPLEEQLENLRNQPIPRLWEGDDFWERIRPLQIRDLEIEIAERDGASAGEAERLRDENWNACRSRK
jgi:hypothetical protein